MRKELVVSILDIEDSSNIDVDRVYNLIEVLITVSQAESVSFDYFNNLLDRVVYELKDKYSKKEIMNKFISYQENGIIKAYTDANSSNFELNGYFLVGYEGVYSFDTYMDYEVGLEEYISDSLTYENKVSIRGIVKILNRINDKFMEFSLLALLPKLNDAYNILNHLKDIEDDICITGNNVIKYYITSESIVVE